MTLALPPLHGGTLLRRYKRFLADIRLDDGQEITAHVANPGAMTGLNREGARVWLSQSPSPKRKLPYSWELVEADFGAGAELVSVNTGRTNAIVEHAIASGAIAELSGYDVIRREVTYGTGHLGTRSRVDFCLEAAGQPSCLVEVKAVSLMRTPGLAEFPDAVTARGARHLAELARARGGGQRAVMLFAIQIGSATAMKIAGDIDKAYLAGFAAAREAGVETLAYTCNVSLDGIDLARKVPIL